MEEEKEYTCTIPRNLNKSDTMPFGRVEVSLKQIAYIASGGALCWYGFELDLPPILKIAISTIGLESGILLAFGKYKGVSMDKAIVDGITYLSRTNHYKNLEKSGELVVTVKAKEEEGNVKTKPKRFSIQSSK